MDSPALFVAFGALMLIAALVAVAIDWFGKPLRHRRFVPKVYRFPDERQPRHSQVRRTDWSESSLVVPVVEAADAHLVRYPDPAVAPPVAPQPSLAADAGPPTAQVPVVDLDLDPIAAGADFGSEPLEPVIDGLVTLEDLERDDPSYAAPDLRADGWATGQYVFNRTHDGNEPTAATVRNRYWKNVAATPGADVFGPDNLDRMRHGNAPQRRNYRTGKMEAMRLANMRFGIDHGATPIPTWPAPELDPFA